MGTPGKPQSRAWPHAFVFSTLSPLCPTALMVALAQGGPRISHPAALPAPVARSQDGAARSWLKKQWG